MLLEHPGTSSHTSALCKAPTKMSPCRPRQEADHSITHLRPVRLSQIPELSTAGAIFFNIFSMFSGCSNFQYYSIFSGLWTLNKNWGSIGLRMCGKCRWLSSATATRVQRLYYCVAAAYSRASTSRHVTVPDSNSTAYGTPTAAVSGLP